MPAWYSSDINFKAPFKKMLKRERKSLSELWQILSGFSPQCFNILIVAVVVSQEEGAEGLAAVGTDRVILWEKNNFMDKKNNSSCSFLHEGHFMRDDSKGQNFFFEMINLFFLWEMTAKVRTFFWNDQLVFFMRDDSKGQNFFRKWSYLPCTIPEEPFVARIVALK